MGNPQSMQATLGYDDDQWHVQDKEDSEASEHQRMWSATSSSIL